MTHFIQPSSYQIVYDIKHEPQIQELLIQAENRNGILPLNLRDFQLIYEIELIFQYLRKESLVAQHNEAHIYQQIGFCGTGCLKFMELNKIIQSNY